MNLFKIIIVRQYILIFIFFSSSMDFYLFVLLYTHYLTSKQLDIFQLPYKQLISRFLSLWERTYTVISII